jgi:hypothetical protein
MGVNNTVLLTTFHFLGIILYFSLHRQRLACQENGKDARG